MVGRVQWICSQLLIAGYCTRGALCFGELEHTDRRIAGKALVEAHRIEREVAKYPRLVLNSEAERVVIEVFPIDESEDPVDDLEVVEAAEPDEMLVVSLPPAYARAFCKRAQAVVAAGRPPCQFCGGPLDPEGHPCPKMN